MASYPTDEDVCNMALGRLGQYTISDIYAEATIPRLCRLHLPQVRRTLLRKHAWNFAISRIELPESATENAFGYEYRFALPEDYLQTMQLFEDEDALCRIDNFKVEGEAILCDHATAFLEYVKDVCSPLCWPADFVEAVVVKLASRLAMPVGAGKGAATELIQELEQLVLPDAHLNNAWEDGSGENNPTQQRLAESEYLRRHNTTI